MVQAPAVLPDNASVIPAAPMDKAQPGTGLASAAAVSPASKASPNPAEASAVTLANYSERVRGMGTPELNAELSRLAQSTAPQEKLQLAVALAQLHQMPELIRAQEAVANVLGNASDEAKALHPLARLLAVRLGEQRRLEDLLDKQNQQVKDLQRRLDQTTERLEALKAIERSLVSRPTPVQPQAAPSAGGANRSRSAPATAPARSAAPQP